MCASQGLRNQLLLRHASVQTTERYLGTKQDPVHAPNDGIKLRVAVSHTLTIPCRLVWFQKTIEATDQLPRLGCALVGKVEVLLKFRDAFRLLDEGRSEIDLAPQVVKALVIP